jgi:hypothetical protein
MILIYRSVISADENSVGLGWTVNTELNAQVSFAAFTQALEYLSMTKELTYCTG